MKKTENNLFLFDREIISLTKTTSIMKIKIHIVAAILAFSLTATAQVSKNENAARAWITSNSKELNIQDFHTFKLNFVRKGLSGETLRFQQMVNDVPVFGAEIVVHFSPKNVITDTSENYDKSIPNINTTPAFSSEEAILKSNKALNITGEIVFQESKLFVYNSKAAATKLVYRVVTESQDKNGTWENIIDAQSGVILSTKEISYKHHDHKKEHGKEDKKHQNTSTTTAAFVGGTAMVFNPDPLSVARVAYGGNYVDNNDATNAQLDAARTTVNLREIDFTGGVYTLKSRYVEIKDVEAPSKGLFTQATPDFHFNRSQDGFEAANVFYHLDKNLTYVNEILGIECIPLNHNGILWFDPSAWSGADNSSYANGTLKFGEGGIDDGEDADVILHELGHGLHDWITNGSLSQVNGLSEGSGDYWAQSYSRSLNQWTSAQAAHHYVFSWDGHNTFWPGRTTNYTRLYPGGLTGSIHDDGQIWATALMKIWDILGREKTDKIFLEGLARTNSSTNQQNAARAARTAAIDMNYSCADVRVITERFTAAGYNMPAVSAVNCPDTQTVMADVNGNYTMTSFTNMATAYSPNCDAVAVQSPAQGEILNPGTYQVTMTVGTATCNFDLIVEDFLGVNNNSKVNNIAVYPNPAFNEITIKGKWDANETISMYNMLGQKVLDKAIDSNEQKVDVSKLQSGVYTIYFNNGKFSYKFVKN